MTYLLMPSNYSIVKIHSTRGYELRYRFNVLDIFHVPLVGGVAEPQDEAAIKIPIDWKSGRTPR